MAEKDLLPCINYGAFNIRFPTRQDSTTFRDKETTEQAQNLATELHGPGQPVKIQDMMPDGTLCDFDSLSHSVPQDKMGQSRERHSKTGKGRSKTEWTVLDSKKVIPTPNNTKYKSLLAIKIEPNLF